MGLVNFGFVCVGEGCCFANWYLVWVLVVDIMLCFNECGVD